MADLDDRWMPTRYVGNIGVKANWRKDIPFEERDDTPVYIKWGVGAGMTLSRDQSVDLIHALLLALQESEIYEP